MSVEIPGYRIIRQLGRGGMATVYLAIQEKFDREVAVKVLSEALVSDPTFGKRFLREARIVAQLSHPNIVQVYDVGVHENVHFLAMEYLEGGELNAKLRQGLELPEIFEITKDIARALNFAHGKGYIHRDIKPENILFREEGSAVLSDFGIARAADSSTQMTRIGSVIGTPHYMSPEQAEGKELDGRSDIYSLGILFYKMLTGDVPYKADSAVAIGIRHITDPLPKLRGELAVFQPYLDRFLAKRAEDRYQTGLEVIEAIEELQRSASLPQTSVKTEIIDTAEIEAVRRSAERVVSSRERATPGATTPAPRTSPLTWITAGVALALLVSAGGYVLLEGTPPWLTTLTRPYLQRHVETPPAPATAPPVQPVVTRVPVAAQPPAAGADTAPVDATATPVTPATAQPASETPQALLAKARDLAADPTANAEALAGAYRKVLALDPANAEATTGLATLAKALQAAASEAVSQGGLEEGQRIVRLALALFPGDPRFTLLASDANAQLSIQRLLQQARSLPRPEAVAAYRQVLARAPDNTEASRGLETVAESFASEALGALNAGDLARAEGILQSAKGLALEHGELNKVSASVAAARDRGAQIEQLMKEGKSLLAKSNSRGAARKFASVLELDGRVTDARSQLTKAVADIARSGSRALAKGDLDTAQARLSEASGYLRDQQQVAVLRHDLRAAQAQRTRVEKLFETAQDRLARGLLSRPENDCASYYLSSVLELEPDHSAAKAALAEVAKQLADIAVEAHDAGLDEDSKDYIRRALKLRPGDESWTRLLQEWESAHAAAAVDTTTSS